MAWIERQWDWIRTSIWIIPSVLCAAAILLALLALQIDRNCTGCGQFLPALSLDADAARQLMGVVATSLISVGGVSFSVTMVALTLTSGQYGPKVLRYFLEDTRGKVSLGLFFAAAVYALIVSVALTDQDQARGTVVLALGLAILAIIEFIGYIHRTASSLQADQLIQRLGQQLRQDMARLRKLGDSETLITDTEGWRRASRGLQRINLYAEREGYVQTADYHRLAACLRQSRSLGMLRVRPGDFVIPGAVLITLWQPESKEPKESRGEEELRAVLDDALVLGPVRTPIQDPQFPITQLQQIAARALSSGINDPGTAVTCIDWLTLSLAEVVDENLPGCVLIDSQGDPRLIVRNPGFAELLDHIFTPLRQFTSDDLQVAHSLLDSLISLARITKRDDHLQLLLTHGQRICDQVERESHPDYDYQHVARRLARLSRSTIGR